GAEGSADFVDGYLHRALRRGFAIDVGRNFGNFLQLFERLRLYGRPSGLRDWRGCGGPAPGKRSIGRRGRKSSGIVEIPKPLVLLLGPRVKLVNPIERCPESSGEQVLIIHLAFDDEVVEPFALLGGRSRARPTTHSMSPGRWLDTSSDILVPDVFNVAFEVQQPVGVPLAVRVHIE